MTWFGWSNEKSSLSNIKSSSPSSPTDYQVLKSKTLDFSNMTDSEIKNKLNELTNLPKSDSQQNFIDLEFANVQYESGNYSEALKFLEKFLATNPNVRSALKLKAKIYDKQENIDLALKTYQTLYIDGCRSIDISERIIALMSILKERNPDLYEKYCSSWQNDKNTCGDLLLILNCKDPLERSYLVTKNLLDSFIVESNYLNKQNMIIKLIDYISQAIKNEELEKYSECLFEAFLISLLNQNSYIEYSIKILNCMENIMNLIGIENIMARSKLVAIYIIISSTTLDFLDFEYPDKACHTSDHSPLIILSLSLSQQIYKDSYTKSDELIQIYQSAYLQNIEKSIEKSSGIFELIKEFNKLKRFNSMLKFDISNMNLLKLLKKFSLFTTQKRPVYYLNLNFERLWIFILISKINSHILFGKLLLNSHWVKNLFLLPNSLNDHSFTFFDLLVFLSAMRHSRVQDDALNNEEMWKNICDYISGSFLKDAYKTKIAMLLVELRLFQFNKLVHLFSQINYCNFEKSLIQELDFMVYHYGDKIDNNTLKKIINSKNSELNFTKLNDFVDNLSSNEKKDSILIDNIPNESNDNKMSLRLVDTINNLIEAQKITNNIPHYNFIDHEHSSNDNHARKQQQTTMKLDDKISKNKDKAKLVKYPKVLYSTDCDMILDRNQREYHGKLLISWKSKDRLSFEFIENSTNLTKVLYFVDFIGSMPKNPIKLKIIDTNRISWTSVDFTNDSKGSIQKSSLIFRNNDEMLQFVDNFAKHQHVESGEVIEDLDINLSVASDQHFDESAVKSSDKSIVDNQQDALDNDDVVYLGEYIPPDLSTEKKQFLLDLMLPLTFYHRTGEPVVDEYCTQSIQSDKNNASKSNDTKSISPTNAINNELESGELDSNSLPKETAKQVQASNLFKNSNIPPSQDNSSISNHETPKFNFSFASKSPTSGGNIFGSLKSNVFSDSTNSKDSSGTQNPVQPQQTFKNIFGSIQHPNQTSNINSSKFQSPKPSIFGNSAKIIDENSKNLLNSTFQFDRFKSDPSKDSADNQQKTVDKKESENVGIKKVDVESLAEIEGEKLEETLGEVVFHHKAKLFRFNEDHMEWKQKGIGIFKIVVPNDKKGQGIAQFLMRREPLMMLNINCYINKDISLDDVGKSVLMTQFAAADYSTGECKNSLFAVKFPTKEIVQTFRKKVEEITNENDQK